METYSDFAQVYDIFMDDTPYEEWAAYLCSLIRQYGVSQPAGERAEEQTEPVSERALAEERNLVVELGCGTGTLTGLMADAGYDMIGIDCSQEMLERALQKKERSGREILYLQQDMRELELYSTVGTVISVCDSLNYLLEEEELLTTFRLVNNYLYPEGIFLFDFNTVYKYEQLLGDATIAENREDCSFIWENYYHPEEELNEYDLTVFVREEETPELFRRFSETHIQRGYTLEQVRRLVEESGLRWVMAVDGDTHEAVTGTSGRILVMAKEHGKSRGGSR